MEKNDTDKQNNKTMLVLMERSSSIFKVFLLSGYPLTVFTYTKSKLPVRVSLATVLLYTTSTANKLLFINIVF